MQRSKLVVLLPPGPDTPMTDFRPVAAAMEAAKYTRESRRPEVLCEVQTLADEELNGYETLELLGEPSGASVEMPCDIQLPFFTIQLKDIGRFLGIELVVRTTDGQARHLLISNKHHAVRVASNAAVLPLVINMGWNKLTVDLADVCRRAFGVEFLTCRNVVLHASVRVARCYFEARPFEDCELPPWLRTLE